MTNTIKLIVGLGNPGTEYAKTRHNVGFWFIEQLAQQHNEKLRAETKFSGLIGKINLAGQDCRLLLPTTYMNQSGQAVNAVAHYFHIPAEAILVIHDELDLPVGDLRLKQNGGDGGHNGLKDISAHLNSKDFWRLRIGISRPEQREQVPDYVLEEPTQEDHSKILEAINNGLQILADVINGEMEKVMQQLHTKQK